MTQAQFTLLRRDDLRPPFAELVFDVALTNPEPQPRWFLLPASVGPDTPAIGSAGVSSAEFVRHSGLAVGKFSGSAPFAALLVPAGGDVSLPGWPLRLWDEPPVTEVEFDVVTAAGVRIGGKPAAEWFDGGPWISDGLAAVAVELADARRERVRVSVV